MNNVRNRRRVFFSNRMHEEIFSVVFLVALLPTMITAFFLYYLIFYITTEHIGIPETIAAHVIPAAKQVSAFLWMTVPIVIGVMLFMAHRIAFRIVGPLDRIIREMDENIQGKRKSTIHLRPKDKLQPLVDRINILLEKMPR